MTTKKKDTKTKVVQKTTKKVVAKKTAKKTPCAISCDCAKMCEPAHAFWVNNGPIVHSIEELVTALKEMSDEQFIYHAKRNGNDFVNWIRDCLQDAECAVAIKKAQTRLGAIRILANKCVC